jgi:hypothetical protein
MDDLDVLQKSPSAAGCRSDFGNCAVSAARRHHANPIDRNGPVQVSQQSVRRCCSWLPSQRRRPDASRQTFSQECIGTRQNHLSGPNNGEGGKPSWPLRRRLLRSLLPRRRPQRRSNNFFSHSLNRSDRAGVLWPRRFHVCLNPPAAVPPTAGLRTLTCVRPKLRMGACRQASASILTRG